MKEVHPQTSQRRRIRANKFVVIANELHQELARNDSSLTCHLQNLGRRGFKPQSAVKSVTVDTGFWSGEVSCVGRKFYPYRSPHREVPAVERPPENRPPQYGVCFDLYSTLVHEDPANPFYRDVADALRIDLERWIPAYRKRGKDSMAGRLSDMSERVRVSAEDSGFHRPRDEVAAAVEAAFPSFVRSVRVDPQAADLLGHLRDRGSRLALLSNASSYSEEILDRVGLRDPFDAVILSYRVGLLKPDPEIYQLALTGLGLPAEAVTFVGDGGDRELSGARKVGMRTILVDRNLPHSESAKADADHVVADLAEVQKIHSDRNSLSL